MSRRMLIAQWVVRVAFALVFAVNVMCAVQFCVTPDDFMGAYQLTGVPGRVAVQGIGVAFLMWNCTYPLVIWQPQRHRTLMAVVLVQQAGGLVVMLLASLFLAVATRRHSAEKTD